MECPAVLRSLTKSSSTKSLPSIQSKRFHKRSFPFVDHFHRVLQRFVQGNQSHDNDVLTAITALNVVIRMEPTMRHTFNIRSFFTDVGKFHLGCGLELWQGLFQSIRPGMGRMLINVDLSTGLMYRAGELWQLCLDVLKEPINERNIQKLQPRSGGQSMGLSESERKLLSKFVHGIKVLIRGQGETPRIIKKLSEKGAKDSMFQLREGGTISVAEYVRRTRNEPLKFPNNFCVEVSIALYDKHDALTPDINSILGRTRTHSYRTLHCPARSNRAQTNSVGENTGCRQIFNQEAIRQTFGHCRWC
jgi:hypothetical protein